MAISNMAQLSLLLGALGGLSGVVLGAFGAHALRDRFDDYSMRVFETAVQYQFYHSLALVAVGILMLSATHTGLLRISTIMFTTGIVLFSGSLYLLSFSGIRWLGAVTPLGGLAFIVGWSCLVLVAIKMGSPNG